VWQRRNGGITYVGDALIWQGFDAIGVGAGYEIYEALQQGVTFENMNPEQKASVAEFIGIAIQKRGSLSAYSFSEAAGFDHLLTSDELTMVMAAHDLLRA